LWAPDLYTENKNYLENPTDLPIKNTLNENKTDEKSVKKIFIFILAITYK